jgi:hypothetical protein
MGPFEGRPGSPLLVAIDGNDITDCVRRPVDHEVRTNDIGEAWLVRETDGGREEVDAGRWRRPEHPGSGGGRFRARALGAPRTRAPPPWLGTKEQKV